MDISLINILIISGINTLKRPQMSRCMTKISFFNFSLGGLHLIFCLLFVKTQTEEWKSFEKFSYVSVFTHMLCKNNQTGKKENKPSSY